MHRQSMTDKHTSSKTHGMPRFAGSRRTKYSYIHTPLHSTLPPPSLFLVALLSNLSHPSLPPLSIYIYIILLLKKRHQARAAVRVQGTEW